MLASLLAGLAFTILALVAPGLAILKGLRLPLEPALVLPIGWALVAGVYWLSLVTAQPWLFPVVVLALDLSLFLPSLPSLGWGWLHTLPKLALLALLGFLAVTQFGWNRYGPEGEFVLDPLVPYDTGFHVGVARELTLGYPPQVPGLAGFRLGYHIGADLVRAAALRWAHVDPYDSITRLDPLLGGVALALLLQAVGRSLGFPRLALALLPWTLLATDFSFVFAANPQAHWWTDLLRGNLLISLCMANPVVPGLALTLGVLLALARHLETNDRAWLALAVALALAVPAFKVFLGAHLLLGLGAAGLRASSRGRVAIVAVALAAALMTGALALGAGGDTVTVTWAPLDLARVTRASLGLAPVGGLRLGAWAAIWLAASLGLRLLGLGRAWAALRGDNPLATALASMALASWPIGLLIRIGAPAMLPGQRPINDVAFLLEQGGALLWVFAVPLVAALAGRFGRAGVLGLSACLCLPSTAQYAIQKNLWPNDAIPAPMVRACRDLERASRPGDVILQRPGGRFPPAPVLLIGRRVPYERFTPWLTQFGTPEALEGRHELVYGFFRTHERAEALAIAQRLEARFACVYGGEHLRFDTTGLESVHDEAAARCYRLVP